MKPLARWSARTPVSANVLMVLIIAGGLFSLMRMRREMFPEFVLDFITISIPYPGASPEEVEEGICIKVEEQIDGIDGIKKIRSSARENVGVVIAELETGTNQMKVFNDLKNRVDQITTFPLEAEEPVISSFVFRRPAINVVIFGDAGEGVLRKIGESIRDGLTATGEITDAGLAGVRNYEISVEVSEAALRRYGLTFDDVSRAISRASLDLPAGVLKTPGGDILLRAKGQRYSGREYEDIPLVTLPDGAIITVGQVAKVVDGFEDVDRYSRYKGKPAVTVQVMQTGHQDVITVVDAVKRYIAARRAELPEGIGIATFQDSSDPVRSRINLLVTNGLQGFMLVFLVLWLFLRWRLAFWVALGIPISFMGAFWVLKAADATINMLSLFAFIMALGIVVDDAIIVGENIHAHRRRGASPYRAAVDGAAEVGWPVVNSVLTTCVAFAPLFFVSGIMGKFIAVMPVAVIATLLVSLVEAFLILPTHLKESFEKQATREVVNETAERRRKKINETIQRFIDRVYTPALIPSLRNRYLTVALAAAGVMVSIGLVTGGRLGFVLFPKIDGDYVFGKVIFPQGTPAATTEAALEKIEESMWRVEEKLKPRLEEGEQLVRHMVTSLGDISRQASEEGVTGAHAGQVYVELLTTERRRIPAQEIMELWREETGEIPGTEQLMFEEAEHGPGGAPIEVRLVGQNLRNLETAAEELKKELATYAGVFDIRDDFLPGKWEIKVKARPEARNLGLNLGDIARQVRQGFYGDEAVRIQRGRDDVKVMVRYPAEERRSRSSVEGMRIRTPQRGEVPLAEVAEIEFGRGYSTIRRVNRQRALTVTADIDETLANAEEIIGSLSREGSPANGNGANKGGLLKGNPAREGFLHQLKRRYPGISFDLEGQARESRESVASLLNGYVYALLAIFCLLAAQFRSYIQPIIVMCAIPVALIGALWGHLIMGLSLTLLSLFGIVALSGVVVNDSLVLIDFINRKIASGASVEEAVVWGGQSRFRAVILTSATTVAGLAPLLFERSPQAQFLIPMAVSLAFGLIAATVITLFVTPALYLIVADVKARLGFRAVRPAVSES